MGLEPSTYGELLDRSIRQEWELRSSIESRSVGMLSALTAAAAAFLAVVAALQSRIAWDRWWVVGLLIAASAGLTASLISGMVSLLPGLASWTAADDLAEAIESVPVEYQQADVTSLAIEELRDLHRIVSHKNTWFSIGAVSFALTILLATAAIALGLLGA